MAFSKKLLSRPEAKNKAVLQRVDLAKRRVQAILDREIVANQKTLEQKISEQGPVNQRVDPHLVGLAVMDLLEFNLLKTSNHQATGTIPWRSNALANEEQIRNKLAVVAPLYASVSIGGFGNLVGDALEIVVFKCLNEVYSKTPRYSFQGAFDLTQPKDAQGRYKKNQPPKNIAQFSTIKEADFLQFGHDAGPLCIECKNYREWLYPHEDYIRNLIVKASDLNAIPVMVARRIHYTTITNFFVPAGIIFHESYLQYYPADKADLAEQVSDKRSLGFTDVVASEEPHSRTRTFFQRILPTLVDDAASRWTKNREALVSYARGESNLAQLYTAIGSPAGGKWMELEDMRPDDY